MVVMIGSLEPSTKLVDNEEHTVTPFFGLDGEGEYANMGVGYVTETGKSQTWGLMAPTMLITSWRAMHILAQLTELDRFTLSKCWYAAAGSSRDTAKAVAALSEQFANHETLEDLIAKVPSPQELDQMLNFVKEHGIQVSHWELLDLVERGLVDDHPIIAEIARKAEKAIERYDARERFIAAPLPERHSLGSLFEQLGIDNLFVSEGFDSWHIKSGDIDSYVKQTSTGEYARPFSLRRTTEPPTPGASELRGFGVTKQATSFGEVEVPYYIDITGTKFAFFSAEYRYDNIVVATQIGDEHPVRINMTVDELREAIVVKKPKKRWLRRR